MPRAVFYVDGFNLYHSLKSHPKTAMCLWLDLWTLCDAVRSRADTLAGVVYFTAMTPWNRFKMARHEAFLSALDATDVEVVKGRFQATKKECGRCNRLYDTYEEKETDVNIASRMIRDAVLDKVDVIYLLTGDADQAPTIRCIRELAPKCEIVSVFSVNRYSAELTALANRKVQLGWAHFKRNQLPNPLELDDGTSIHCPPSWAPTEPKDKK